MHAQEPGQFICKYGNNGRQLSARSLFTPYETDLPGIKKTGDAFRATGVI